MPIVDMPLKELYEFKGLNECPADLDAFWDRGIAEMEALGTGCTLEKAQFQTDNVECFEMYFIGMGGARIHCRMARPAKREGKLPAICAASRTTLRKYSLSGSGSSRPRMMWPCSVLPFTGMMSSDLPPCPRQLIATAT